MKFAAVAAALAAVMLTVTPPLPAGQVCSMFADGVCRCHHDEGAAPCCEIVPEYPSEEGLTTPTLRISSVGPCGEVPIADPLIIGFLDHEQDPEVFLPPRHGPPLYLEIESLLI